MASKDLKGLMSNRATPEIKRGRGLTLSVDEQEVNQESSNTVNQEVSNEVKNSQPEVKRTKSKEEKDQERKARQATIYFHPGDLPRLQLIAAQHYANTGNRIDRTDIVREGTAYLLDHPEVMQEVLKRLP